jgi:hypothetical protein
MWTQTTRVKTRGCRSRGPAKKHAISKQKNTKEGWRRRTRTRKETHLLPHHPLPRALRQVLTPRRQRARRRAQRRVLRIAVSARRCLGRTWSCCGAYCAVVPVAEPFIGAGVADGNPALLYHTPVPATVSHSRRRISIPNPAPLPLLLLRRLPLPIQQHRTKPFQRRARAAAPRPARVSTTAPFIPFMEHSHPKRPRNTAQAHQNTAYVPWKQSTA